MEIISGFSKLSKQDKIAWLSKAYLNNETNLDKFFSSFNHQDKKIQNDFEDFSENTLTNFYLPFGVAPNIVINNKTYCVPMVTEESSVVAAASRSAKFWLDKGGFKTTIVNTTKNGQVHFYFDGEKKELFNKFNEYKNIFISNCASITSNMEKRGGGLLSIELLDKTDLDQDYFQLFAKFETCDAMGANFINSVLEDLANTLKQVEPRVDIVMSILSNYTPECIVSCQVDCPIEQLGSFGGLSAKEFAKKFERAVRIANIEPHRATTHNKGIFNGVDAVILATGNDFRAVEACGHTYAAKDGHYKSLSQCHITKDHFTFELTLPMALGTVGGITSLHPLAKKSLQILGNPSARELMGIAAAIGLAQNFAAVRSLTTTGIQQGHMKMHLKNILKQENATEFQYQEALEFFKTKTVSYNAVRDFLSMIRTAH